MPTRHRGIVLVAAVLGIVLFAAACGNAAAPPTTSPPPGATEPSPGGPSDAPPVVSGPGGSGGGGVPGDPGSGSGIGLPIGPTPVDPGAGQPTIVMPKPGRLNPHPVAPIALQSSVEGRHVLVKVSWFGGVAPCSVLDSVKVERSASTIELIVLEGADQADGVCPEIAMLKATIVDLGELEPGTWSIRATNSDVAPLIVTIS